ncbi:MAG TPA: MEDS domain-containing protein [Nitrososphaeraceae archaeon]|nr:MEDS domain-containing protein [Nitrososphaeraceae archaeon]
MEAEKTSYRPFKFLDRMEGNNHIVLLYDNPKYADLLMARYFSNGLKKGESCIFFTPDNPEQVRKRLSTQGIVIDSIRIFQVEGDNRNRSDALSLLKTIKDEATRGMKPPYRFVGRTISDTGTIEGMKRGLHVEKTGNDHFQEFDCSQMCYYDISEIEQSMRDEWIRALLINHHHAIYASNPDKAVAFETDLLHEEN